MLVTTFLAACVGEVSAQTNLEIDATQRLPLDLPGVIDLADSVHLDDGAVGSRIGLGFHGSYS